MEADLSAPLREGPEGDEIRRQTPPGRAPAGLALFAPAPVATATGFAIGLLLGERLTSRGGSVFLEAWAWSLASCAFGAIVGFGFGPMLIVFGMFVFGTVAVPLREVRHRTRRAPPRRLVFSMLCRAAAAQPQCRPCRWYGRE